MTTATDITIPAAIVPVVQREALILIAQAGGDIQGLRECRELDPEAIDEALTRLDRSRALVKDIGWPAPGADVAVGPEHVRALLGGLGVGMNVRIDMAAASRHEGDTETEQRHNAELDTLLDYAGALSRERDGA